MPYINVVRTDGSFYIAGDPAPLPVRQGSRAAATADTHAPASNTAAVLTYAGATGVSHVLTGVAWSYDGDPTGGTIQIEDGSGHVVFGPLPISSKGPGVIPFPEPKRGTSGRALIVTLTAGGSGVSGVVSALNHWTE